MRVNARKRDAVNFSYKMRIKAFTFPQHKQRRDLHVSREEKKSSINAPCFSLSRCSFFPGKASRDKEKESTRETKDEVKVFLANKKTKKRTKIL